MSKINSNCLATEHAVFTLQPHGLQQGQRETGTLGGCAAWYGWSFSYVSGWYSKHDIIMNNSQTLILTLFIDFQVRKYI